MQVMISPGKANSIITCVWWEEVPCLERGRWQWWERTLVFVLSLGCYSDSMQNLKSGGQLHHYLISYYSFVCQGQKTQL